MASSVNAFCVQNPFPLLWGSAILHNRSRIGWFSIFIILSGPSLLSRGGGVWRIFWTYYTFFGVCVFLFWHRYTYFLSYFGKYDNFLASLFWHKQCHLIIPIRCATTFFKGNACIITYAMSPMNNPKRITACWQRCSVPPLPDLWGSAVALHCRPLRGWF